MYEISKLVSNRRAWGLMVAKAGRVHADQIADAIGGELDGREGFDGAQTRLFIMALADHLQELTEEMAQKEQAYVLESGDVVAPRARRDELVKQGREAIMGLRQQTRDLVGQDAPRRFAIPASTPVGVGEIVEALETISAAMAANPTQVSSSLGTTFNSTQAAAGLSRLADEIRQALDDIATETREMEGALIDRNRTVTEWTRSYRATASTLSNLFLLAGHEELAERVRPSERRASGQREPTPEDLELGEPTDDPSETVDPQVDPV